MPDFINMFAELIEYFRVKYFSPDLSTVVNFDATDTERFLPFLIVGISLGIFAAACIYYYNSEYLGRVVRALYKAGAFTKEDGKTLDELGCNHKAVRKNLVTYTVLSRYVKPCEPINGKEDAKTARFYLVEETKYIADKRFKPVKGGLKTLALLFVVCAALCFFLLYYTPDVIQFLDNAIGLIKKI